MYCRKCGAELPDGSLFCSECGAQQRAPAPAPAPMPEPVPTPVQEPAPAPAEQTVQTVSPVAGATVVMDANEPVRRHERDCNPTHLYEQTPAAVAVADPVPAPAEAAVPPQAPDTAQQPVQPPVAPPPAPPCEPVYAAPAPEPVPAKKKKRTGLTVLICVLVLVVLLAAAAAVLYFTGKFDDWFGDSRPTVSDRADEDEDEEAAKDKPIEPETPAEPEIVLTAVEDAGLELEPGAYRLSGDLIGDEEMYLRMEGETLSLYANGVWMEYEAVFDPATRTYPLSDGDSDTVIVVVEVAGELRLYPVDTWDIADYDDEELAAIGAEQGIILTYGGDLVDYDDYSVLTEIAENLLPAENPKVTLPVVTGDEASAAMGTANMGLATMAGNQLYFIGSDRAIYVSDLAGENLQSFYDEAASYGLFAAADGYLYFIEGDLYAYTGGDLCRMPLTGGAVERVATGALDYVTVVDELVYFLNTDRAICAAHTDGSSQRVVSDQAEFSWVTWYDGNLYACGYEIPTLYRVDPYYDSTEVLYESENEGTIWNPIVCGEDLFFYSGWDSLLYAYSLRDGTLLPVIECYDYFGVHDGWIYYTEYGTDICRVRLDGSVTEDLSAELYGYGIYALSPAGDFLFFMDEDGDIGVLTTDGTFYGYC